MSNFKILSLSFLLLVFVFACTSSKPTTPWHLGVQTYTFHKVSLMEALDKTQALGLTYAEAYLGQKLGSGFSDTAHLDCTLSKEQLGQVKAEFAKRGIKLYALGVVVYSTKNEWVKFFEIAEELGCEAVTCEPMNEHLAFVDSLAQLHKIKAAIHNHPGESLYAQPEAVIKALEGRSEYMGVCADPGHWKRMGYDPIESLKLFPNRIMMVHFKDLDAKMEDTVWGTGVLNVAGMLDVLHKQGFTGVLSMEYENFSDKQDEDLKKNLEYYQNLGYK